MSAGVLDRAGRLWRTVRWLRREQWLGRARQYLPRKGPNLSPGPALRAAAGPWVPPPARARSLCGPQRWLLLGEEHDLADVGWDDPALPLLWRYNQHYFDDLNAQDAVSRLHWHRALVARWCAECPPGRGTAWAPYPTSLRIVNWLKWHLGGECLDQKALHSLAVQARWLEQRLEWHLLGNHLFVNAKALVFAGLVFDGSEARRWLAKGAAVLARELPEQFLSDGAQFERAPMYHALALEDLLDLLNLLAARAPQVEGQLQVLRDDLAQRASAALVWLRQMRHPDGTLGRFNDTAEGIAPATDDIETYAAALGVDAARSAAEGLAWLKASGYVRAASGPAVALLDLAPVGPDYLPGHAHADTLSYELSLRGRALVVNRGTSEYGTGPQRQRERGTAAHSTLQIGNQDSSEVWAGFRVGRRARPGPVKVEGWTIEGSHDGYAHLPGCPVHWRRWRFAPDGLLVEDRLVPPAREPACVRHHLAPGLRLRPTSNGWQIVDADGNVQATARVDGGTAKVERWQHAVAFGQLVPAETLAVHLNADRCTLQWHW